MSSGHMQTPRGLVSSQSTTPSPSPKPKLLTYKVVLLGEGGVGKTSLVESFCDKKFCETMKTTIGAALTTKVFSTPEAGDIRLVIWDIGGEKRFNDMAPSFFLGADGALVVFDLSRPHTLHLLNEWINRFKSSLNEYLERLKSTSKSPLLVESAAEKVNSVSILIVGNKTDVRVMQSDEGQKFAQGLGYKYLETSAKNFNEVNDMFVELTRMILKGRH